VRNVARSLRRRKQKLRKQVTNKRKTLFSNLPKVPLRDLPQN
jgi:hypothetical protein